MENSFYNELKNTKNMSHVYIAKFNITVIRDNYHTLFDLSEKFICVD